jgi:hypothetical protein
VAVFFSILSFYFPIHFYQLPERIMPGLESVRRRSIGKRAWYSLLETETTFPIDLALLVLAYLSPGPFVSTFGPKTKNNTRFADLPCVQCIRQIGQHVTLKLGRVTGLAVWNGLVFCVERDRHRVSVVRSDDGSFVRFIGVTRLNTPLCAKVSNNGCLYVIEDMAGRVALFEANDGSFIGYLLIEGDSPCSIAVADDDDEVIILGNCGIYAIDHENKNVKKITNYQNSIISSTICVDGGLMYVAEFLKDHVLVLDMKGNFILTIGTGQLANPSGVLVSDGLLYVSEQNLHRISVFQVNGGGEGEPTFVGFIGIGQLWRPGDLAMPEDRTRLYVANSECSDIDGQISMLTLC